MADNDTMAVMIKKYITAYLRTLNPDFDESRWKSRRAVEGYDEMTYSLNFIDAGVVSRRTPQPISVEVHDSWRITSSEYGDRYEPEYIKLYFVDYSTTRNVYLSENALERTLSDLQLIKEGTTAPPRDEGSIVETPPRNNARIVQPPPIDYEALILEKIRNCWSRWNSHAIMLLVDTTIDDVNQRITREDVAHVGRFRLQAIIADLISERMQEKLEAKIAAAWPDRRDVASAMQDLDARLSRIASMT